MEEMVTIGTDGMAVATIITIGIHVVHIRVTPDIGGITMDTDLFTDDYLPALLS